MDISRRKFIYKTSALAAGSCLVPALPLTSCNPAGKARHVRLGFVGPEEHFRYYTPVFQKLKNTKVEMSSFEESLKSDFHAIFINSFPNIKATHIILLLEENKDIITPYPLASSLYEYNRIQEFLDRYDRVVGMLNTRKSSGGVKHTGGYRILSNPGKLPSPATGQGISYK